jgi:hypothetical protein
MRERKRRQCRRDFRQRRGRGEPRQANVHAVIEIQLLRHLHKRGDRLRASLQAEHPRREGLSSAARPPGGHNPLLFPRSKLFRRANQRAAAALRPSRLTCIGGVHADGDVAKLLPGALPACDFGFCIAEPPLSPRSRSAVAPKHKRAKADKTRGARYNSERVPAASSCVNLSAPNLPVAPSTDCAHNGDHGRTDQPSDIRRR